MKLKKIHNSKKKTGGTKTEKNTESVLSALTPGLCFDFHPTVSWQYKWVDHVLVVVKLDFSSITVEIHTCWRAVVVKVLWHSFVFLYICLMTLVPCITLLFSFFSVSTGLQYLPGWYMGRSHPQVFLLQQSAVSGDLQETLCKCFSIKASVVKNDWTLHRINYLNAAALKAKNYSM